MLDETDGADEELNTEQLLNINMDDVREPPRLPSGPYLATLMQWEITRHPFFESEVEQGQKRLIIRFRVKLDDFGKDIAEPLRADISLNGRPPLNWDISFEDKGASLKRALKGLNIIVDGRTFLAALADTAMLPVIAQVKTGKSKKDPSRMFTQITTVQAQ